MSEPIGVEDEDEPAPVTAELDAGVAAPVEPASEEAQPDAVAAEDEPQAEPEDAKPKDAKPKAKRERKPAQSEKATEDRP